MKKERNTYQDYWDENIGKWGELYLDISHGHETLRGNKLLAWIYNHTVVPHEAKLMKVRYQKTLEFIDKHVTPGTVVTDIGCGTGIFVVQCLLRGAKVNAVDISTESLEITRRNVEKQCPQHVNNVTYQECDAQETPIKNESDFTICVGVMPYITNIDYFVVNILKSTRMAFIQFSSKNNLINIIRIIFPLLNVRNLQFHTEMEISTISRKCDFIAARSEVFATGRLITLEKTV
jgi:precorrin-6B methylase 2